MRVENTDLLRLLLAMACLVISSCATQKFYHGLEATNLTGLSHGMKRLDAEKITGNPKREFQCDSGTIVTYIYNRGYTGCIGAGRCDPENETKLQTVEIVADVFSFGMMSANINLCITPCQKGHLELFFDNKEQLIGIRELTTDRDNYCWTSGNKPHQGYPCNRIYSNRRPSSVPDKLILFIDQEDIPNKICDQFTQ